MGQKVEIIRLDLSEREFLIEAESAAEAAAIVRSSVPERDFEVSMPPIYLLADEDLDLQRDVEDNPPPGYKSYRPNVYAVRAQKREWRWVEIDAEPVPDHEGREKLIRKAKGVEFNPGVHAEYLVVDVEKQD